MVEATTERVCQKSPTGAHHWMLGQGYAVVSGTCKYCHEDKEFHPIEDTTEGSGMKSLFRTRVSTRVSKN